MDSENPNQQVGNSQAYEKRVRAFLASLFEEYPDGENISCSDQSPQYTKIYIPEYVPWVKIHFAGRCFSFDLPWKQTFVIKSEQ